MTVERRASTTRDGDAGIGCGHTAGVTMPVRHRAAFVAVALLSLLGAATLATASSSKSAAVVTDGTASSDTNDNAPPPEGGTELTREEAARQAAQLPYFALSEEVWRISEESEPGQVISGQFEINSDRYVVNWYGDVPPSLDELVERAATDQGIEVEIRRAVHSRDALEAAAMELARAVPDPAGMSVAINPDGSGLSVSWPVVEHDPTRRDDLDAAMEMARAKGIDVVFDATKGTAVDFGREAEKSLSTTGAAAR